MENIFKYKYFKYKTLYLGKSTIKNKNLYGGRCNYNIKKLNGAGGKRLLLQVGDGSVYGISFEFFLKCETLKNLTNYPENKEDINDWYDQHSTTDIPVPDIMTISQLENLINYYELNSDVRPLFVQRNNLDDTELVNLINHMAYLDTSNNEHERFAALNELFERIKDNKEIGTTHIINEDMLYDMLAMILDNENPTSRISKLLHIGEISQSSNEFIQETFNDYFKLTEYIDIWNVIIKVLSDLNNYNKNTDSLMDSEESLAEEVNNISSKTNNSVQLYKIINSFLSIKNITIEKLLAILRYNDEREKDNRKLVDYIIYKIEMSENNKEIISSLLDLPTKLILEIINKIITSIKDDQLIDKKFLTDRSIAKIFFDSISSNAINIRLINKYVSDELRDDLSLMSYLAIKFHGNNIPIKEDGELTTNEDFKNLYNMLDKFT